MDFTVKCFLPITDKIEDGKSIVKQKWILYATVLLVFIGVAMPVGTLIVYAQYMGGISKDAADWGNFGSLISGAFTFLGSVATIATLCFVAFQQINLDERQKKQDVEIRKNQEKHDMVILKQTAALNFEQYLKHRTAFVDLLKKVEADSSITVYFEKKEETYARIFYKNNPTHCDYTVPIHSPNQICGDLSDILSARQELKKSMSGERPAKDAPVLVENMLAKLLISHTSKSSEGDVIIRGQKTGFNIYDPYLCFFALDKIINSILFFVGQEKLEPTNLSEKQYLRDETFKHYHIEKVPEAFIHYGSSQLELIHLLRIQASKTTLMPQTVKNAETALDDPQRGTSTNYIIMMRGDAKSELDTVKAHLKNDEDSIFIKETEKLIERFESIPKNLFF